MTDPLSRLSIRVEPPELNGKRMIRALYDGSHVYAARLDPYIEPHRVEFCQALLVRCPELAEAFWHPEKETDLRPIGTMITDACEAADAPEAVEPISAGQLIADNPNLYPAVIAGIIRRRETANLIAATKTGKSWGSLDMGLCVISGGKFLDTFQCTPGRVLLIDNELHAPTLASRIWTVAQAKGLTPDEYQDDLDIITLRGKRFDLQAVARLLEQFEPGKYALVIHDAWYRSLPFGVSENDNRQVMDLYNLLDEVTQRLDCAWVNIHHSSKGSQAGKEVTDVGSGAGAQSRAVDCHMVLRAHEEEGAAVFEAAVRSFPPVAPLGIRWQFPLWRPDEELDASKLKGRLNAKEVKQSESDREGMDQIAKALEDGAATIRILRGRTGFGKSKVERLLDALEAKGRVKWEQITIRGNPCRQYELIQEVAQVNNGSAHANGYIDF